MKSKGKGFRPQARVKSTLDQPRLPTFGEPQVQSEGSERCRIVDVGKRRDGGTRYWCLSHKADATAKYGKRARECRASHVPPITASETFVFNLDEYLGGVALWGAVPPVYDTTRLSLDRGIHIHARRTEDDQKEIDCTYRAVRLLSARLPKEGLLVSELDAIYYMVASVFGYEMKQVVCTYCGHPHLDRDWFSVHPHRRHLCAGCGKHFRDTDIGIGNPICGVRDACGITRQTSKESKDNLDIRQEDFPGGVQIWGSNLAFIWTSQREEAEGIHVHAFKTEKAEPDLDETYAEVRIDGVKLDPLMVRVSMAQSALPHINGRVVSIDCPSCGSPQFGFGEASFTPVVEHRCKRCGHEFAAPGRLRKKIANPLPAILDRLAHHAPRKPQKHAVDLLPETL